MLLIAAMVMAGQVLSPAHATKPSSEPFALIERQRISETAWLNFGSLEVLEAHTISPQRQKIPVAANVIRAVEGNNSLGTASKLKFNKI